MNAVLRVMSSKAPAALLPRLLERIALSRGLAWEHCALGGVEAVARLREDQAGAFDIAVLERTALETLAEEGLIRRASLTDVVLSRTAIAVGAGSLRPDVGSVASLVKALRQASTIGYSTGPSGRALLGLLVAWGLFDELQGRLVQAPTGVPVGRLIREGRVALGFQQLSELRGVQDIEVLGLMPKGAEIDTVFSAAVCAGSTQPDRSGAVIAAMASPDFKRLRAERGFDEAPAR